MSTSRKEKLRLLLLGDSTNDERDELIDVLLDYAEARFKLVVRQAELEFEMPVTGAIPSELDWIIDEAVALRFNRIGSEGYTSESIEGHAITFDSSDFARYANDIYAYFKAESGSTRGGRIIAL